MADPQLQSPNNPHFFQPILPGFETHLNIPVTFFSRYIEGVNDQITAKLISDASDKTWEVKLDGRRLTEGWKDFTTAHALRTGDVVAFKHQGNIVFHVTPLGPSCCEIEYHTSKEEDKSDDDNENRNVLRKKNSKPKTEQACSYSSLSFNYCFVVEVTDTDLKSDSLHLPMEATNSIALNRRSYHKIKLVNEEGISWTVRLKSGGGFYYIKRGWRSFCLENRHKVGDLITFNLVGDGETTPLLCVCPEEKCVELISEYKSKEREDKKKKKRRCFWTASSSARKNRFVTIDLTRYNIQNSKLNLPTTFVKFNGIDDHERIELMDKYGEKRLVRLTQDGPRRGLGQGWKCFCKANDVFKAGESFALELIWENSLPVLKFGYKVKYE